MSILASSQSSSTSESLRSGFAHAAERFDVLAHPDLLIETINSLSMVLAIILFAVGAVCLLRGWKWHRMIVLVLALLVGIGLGHAMTLSMGRSMVIAIAVGLLCAALAAPMLKWTIAILAGLVGAFIGANAWGLLAPDAASEAWAGAGMGFIALALASFILSRLVITFFMSVSGGGLFIMGAFGIMMQIDSIQGPVLEHLRDVPMIVPLLIAVASVMGFIIQRPKLDLQLNDGGSDEDG